MSLDTLHASPWQGVFYVTGGGSFLLSDLLTVPGASRTVLEARIPYAANALTQVLGIEPSQACSESSARMLAMQAFTKAQELNTNGVLFGMGITASLGTNRPKRGQLRAYIALQSSSRTQVSNLLFSQSENREEQERRLASVALRKLCIGLGISTEEMDGEQDRFLVASRDVQKLVESEPHYVGSPGTAFLPGSFDPLHVAHRRMKAIAETRFGSPVQYELCVRNVDKPSLDFLEIERRCEQIDGADLVVSNLPRFSDKAKYLVPNGGARFVVGIDTLTRLACTKYYSGQTARDNAIEFFRDRGDRFLVFGRADQRGVFNTLKDLPVPEALLKICEEVMEEEFRLDVSSTELKREGKN